MIVWIVLGTLNLMSFSLMGFDKRQAKRQNMRVRERTLWSWTIFGGSFGVLMGMYLFRHKTKHLTFLVFVPLMVLLQACLLLYIAY
ncbi:DUF1294 domain-containing protein [Salsuginibacillus kocurii]|uniref:DUF1294 domain-containing protein n=1 Tax=Salsuginibacillus kocurii TaxID=427078 RepID=UPI0003695271|nr:DUF1294 domain-containing protein [Salsuginibacillus kocurii]